jgi:hypothetical protein
MADQGITRGRPMIFDRPRQATGGYNQPQQAGSPYLQSFIQPAEVAQTAQFERELQMDRNNREQQSFDAAQARALRQEEFQNRELEYRQKAEDRRLEAANLALRKQDAKDALDLEERKRETEASEVAGTIGLLNEASPTFRDDLKKIVSDNAKIFTSKYAKFPLAEMETKKKEHSDYVGWLSTTAKENGYTGDVYSLPKNDRGEFDTTANGQIFGPKGVFTSAFAQKQLRDEAETQKKMQDARERSFIGESTRVKLPDGEVITVEAQKPEKPVDQKKEDLAFEKRFGMPASMLIAPMGQAGQTVKVRGNMVNNKFVEAEEGDQIMFKDKRDSKLKGGKIIPYSIYLEEEEKRKPNAPSASQSGVGMQGGTAFIPSSSPTSLPPTEPQAITDSPIQPTKAIDWSKYNQ